ncbi:hypothetical protein RhiXN_05386 [Rhizoctonia solani]|uniref:Uncharacterized protein n=1 Tax=Rhizoctonia solani TaxID=456999 RepID=A0A8H8STR5_9AGAM|nr:uncharacterized protein RhiXN_05386 [Rhizoctonia solani]QRW17384.1 hypothetical protein RhiXN_05386 [Rhizoctonia solani]
MIGRIFGKKDTGSEGASDDSPRRPRFRRTKSAASESIYADYESDDWGDAATIHVDRDGNRIRTGSENDSLEDWQRQPGLIARMRSLSISRPNFTRAPPAPTAYGWAARVEGAGGFDETQQRRDEERSHRPVTMPVPNPAPAPIDVRGGVEFPVLDEAPPPALLSQSSSLSIEPGARILDDRSGTSSPKVIDPKAIGKKGPQDMIGSIKPGQLGAYTRRRHLSRVEKIAAVIQHVAGLPFITDSPVKTYYPPKDKEVIPPVEPYRAFDKTVPKRYLPPPPMPPSWYQPKPPKPKKTKEPKKPKEPKESKQPKKLGPPGGIHIADDRGFPLDPSDNEFTYPDYDNPYYYPESPYNWEGDTPTLQSDLTTTEESASYYEQPRPTAGIDFATLPVRPAFFPAPIKSTGLTTLPNQHAPYYGPLQIADSPYYGDEDDEDYDEDEYEYEYEYEYDDDDYSPTESSHAPIPSPLTTAYDPRISRVPTLHARTPLAITYPIPAPESSSAFTAPGPPLVIPSPTAQLQVASTAAPAAAPAAASASANARLGPLPGGYSSSEQPFAKHYDAYVPPKDKKQKRSPKESSGMSSRSKDGPSPRSKPGPSPLSKSGPSPLSRPGQPPLSKHGPSPRSKPGPSPQVLYEPSPYGFGPPLRPPSNMKIGLSSRAPAGPVGVSSQPPYGPSAPATHRPSPGTSYGPSPEMSYGPSPGMSYGPSPGMSYGPSPGMSYGPSPNIPYGFPYKPSPQTAWGPSPQAPYGIPPKGPSPQVPYGLPMHGAYGPSPQAPYGPSPQTAYDPGTYGPPTHDAPTHPYAYLARTGTPTYVDPIKDQYVWGWGAREIGPDGLPLPPPIPGESPPPVPSPIASVTSIARSRSSRRG